MASHDDAGGELDQARREIARLNRALQERDGLIGIAPAFFGFLSPEGRVQHCNDLALSIIGARREEVIGQLFWEAAWWDSLPDSAERARQGVADAAAGRSVHLDLRYSVLRDGLRARRCVALSLAPALDVAGRVVGIAVAGINVTDRGLPHGEGEAGRADGELALAGAEEARRQAESASRAKDALLARVSLELRTPLNSILGWAHMLRYGSLDPVASRHGVETIERNAKVQARMVEELLEASRRTASPPLPVTRLEDPDLGPARDPSPAKEPAARSGGASSLGAITVLVLDDEPDARELLGVILRAYGAEVLMAESAEQAMRLLVRHSPTVLVSDIGMPVMDGYALIRQVRSLDAETSRIPAIALTAFARAEDRQRALAAGFQAHVTKPIAPDELVSLVRELAGSAVGHG